MFTKQLGVNMEGTVLIFFYALAVAQADIEGFFENGCPRDTSIEKLLPHENCSQFYECHRGILITRNCPMGLHFDAKLEKCDWLASEDSKCRIKRADDVPEHPEDLDNNNPRNAISICSATDSKDILIPHDNCNEFYKCSYGRPIVLKCAQSLMFNPVNKKCDLPEHVDCNDRAISMIEHNDVVLKRDATHLNTVYTAFNADSEPSRAPAICAASGSEGVLVAHENCNQFYKCFNGKPIALKCPENLLYNSHKLFCDQPRNVDCDDRLSLENDDSNNDNISDINTNSIENEIFNGKNDKSDPTQAPFICATPKSEGSLVAHENCNQYYKCKNGRPMALHCPGNLLFNPKKSYCDWQSNVVCDDRTIPGRNDDNGDEEITTLADDVEAGHSDPSEASAICKGEGSDGVLIAHEHCNKFYKCYNGYPVELKCPGYLLYKPQKENCETPNEVDCGERDLPDRKRYANKSTKENIKDIDHNDPRKAPGICAAENSDGILITHENCNQFYKCIEGRAIPLFCQLNLLYNPVKRNCDWPRNVDCGQRMIPGDNANTDENNIAFSCSDDPDGVVAHENCNQFYKCLNGKTYPMDCPPGLHFNSITKSCDWPTNVDCGDRLTESQTLLQKHRESRKKYIL